MGIFKRLFNSESKTTSENTTKSEDKAKALNLTEVICQTWNDLNVEVIEPYLDDNLVYNSVWVGSTIVGKKDYLYYLKRKLDTFKKTNTIPKFDEINEFGRTLPHFLQGDNEGVLDYQQKDGKIISLLMRPLAKIRLVEDEEWPRYSQAYEQFLPQATRIAGQSINELAQKKGLNQSQFAWLQTYPNYPSFQHLCFRTSSQVFSVLIAMHGFSSNGKDDNSIVVYKRDYDRLIMEANKNHLVPCICPICGIPRMPMLGRTHLLHAITGSLIDFDKEYDYNDGKMSPWEINNFGISTVVNFLHNQGCNNIFYCDVMGIEPQIFFEKDGNKAFVLVRSIPAGLREQPFEINKKLLDKFSDYKGYFADVQFVRAHNNGDFNDKYLPRGDSFFSNFKGLQEMNLAIHNNPFIILVDKESYDI